MNKLTLKGIFGWELTAEILNDFLKEAGGKPITVEMSSPGGSVFEAFDMFNLIKDYKGEATIVLGAMAVSCGSFFPLAFDKRIAHKNTCFMAHKVTSYAYGDIDTLQNEINLMTGLESIVQGYYNSIGIEIDLATLGNKEEWVIGGNKLVDLGFVDEVIDDDDDTKDSTKDLAVNAFNQAKIKCKDDFEKREVKDYLAKFKNFKEKIKPKKTINNKNKEIKMDRKTLKNEDPTVYNEIVAEGEKQGVENEKERVATLMNFIESSPKEVKAAIADGTKVTSSLQASLVSKQVAFLVKGGKLKNVEEENPENVVVLDPEDITKTKDEEDAKKMADASAALIAKYGGGK